MGMSQKKIMDGNRKFKILRLTAGVTQKEIERSTGIYASKLSYFENGFAIPSPEEAKKLAAVMRCKREDILACFSETKTP